MKQWDYILEIARLALSNETDHLVQILYDFIAYLDKTNKPKLALQLQEIIKETGQKEELGKLREINHRSDIDNGLEDLILREVVSSYTLDNLICTDKVRSALQRFIRERQEKELLSSLGIPASNKIILHGPSGCGKTLAAYALAGELRQPLFIVNLGNMVFSQDGETCRYLTHIFQRASYEKAIIFLDKLETICYRVDNEPLKCGTNRVSNTLLQLFEFLYKDIVIIATTNKIQTIDEALLRSFDLSVKLDYPTREQIELLIDSTLHGRYEFDDLIVKNQVIDFCWNLSYHSIKKSVMALIRRTIMEKGPDCRTIDAQLWKSLVMEEFEKI